LKKRNAITTDAWTEANKILGCRDVCKLDPIATFATQSICDLNPTKINNLKRCIRSEIGVSIFSTPQKIDNQLVQKYVEPSTGTFKEKDETIALGKEGSASWWCPYCNVQKRVWQEAGYQPGTPWTIARLKEHAKLVAEGKFKEKIDCRGVVTTPIFSSIDVTHFVIPLLHYTIGKGNDGMQMLRKECQAAAAVYSPEYLEAEANLFKAKDAVQGKRDEIESFNQHHSEYKKDLKKEKKNKQTLDTLTWELVCSELDDLENIKTEMKKELDAAKIQEETAKKILEVEVKKPENSKAAGQPLLATIDSILKKYGIDRGAQFGGTLLDQGVIN
jgi:hypothetical protein